MGLSHMDLLSLRQLHIPLWKGKNNHSVEDFDRNALALTAGRAGDQRTNRHDGLAALAHDLTDILFPAADLDRAPLFRLFGADAHVAGVVNQRANHVADEPLQIMQTSAGRQS